MSWERIEDKIIDENSVTNNLIILKNTLLKYLDGDKMEKNKAKRIIFEASLLTEKTIFYLQLRNGVENIAVNNNKLNLHEKESIKREEILKIINTLEYDNDVLDKLYKIRNFVVEEYKRLKR
jgi:hypothetical protein